MNKLIDFFARQHTFVNLITIFILLIGVLSALQIQRESFPQIDFDFITISTSYPSASPSTVEQLITTPLETRLKSINGVDKSTSISISGRSAIILKLDPSQTSNLIAKQEVEDAIGNFPEKPEGAFDPFVSEASSRYTRVLRIALSGNTDLNNIKETAKNLGHKLETSKGIAKVDYTGLPSNEIKIEARPSDLKKYNLNILEIINALKTAKFDVPAGSFKTNGTEAKEFMIRTVSSLNNIKDIESIVLRSNIREDFITIKDVANVYSTLKTEDILYKTNNNPSINMTIYAQRNADSIRLVDKIRTMLDEYKKTMPKDINMRIYSDSSKYVRQRLSTLSNNLLLGLVLVLAILTFMLPFKMAIIAALGVPFSFLATITVFELTGTTLNLLSMMGLIIVVGMLVDDAIVVTENSQRLLEKGLSPREAAIKGAQQVWAPIMTSTLTTLAAFIPMMFIPGMFGKFTWFIPLGVIIALIFSLFECLFILPSHIADWFKPKTYKEKKYSFNNLWNNYLSPNYLKFVSLGIRFRYIVITATVIFAAASFWFAFNKMPLSMFPGSSSNQFSIFIETAVDSPLEKTAAITEKIEESVSKYTINNLDAMTSSIGKQSASSHGSTRNNRGSQYAQINVNLKEELTEGVSVKNIMNQIKKEIKPLITENKITFSRGRRGPTTSKAVNIEIVGESYTDLKKASLSIQNVLSKIKGVRDIEDSMIKGKKEIIVKLDEKRLALSSLTKPEVSETIRAFFDGVVANTIQRLDEEIDIRVTVPEKYKVSMSSLSGLYVTNRRGQPIPLSSIASLTKQSTIGSLQHINGLRTLTVQAEIDRNITTPKETNEALLKAISPIKSSFPKLMFNFSGEEQERKESFASLSKILIIAIFAILMLMILQFNSLLQPLSILLMIPLGFSFVIWIFYIHNMKISFLALIGMIALAGIIVNNAIILIDFINTERKRSINLKDSILMATKYRLRAIFLTTITTAVGVLPTAYGVGGSDRFVVPIAISLGWGVLSGAFLSTFILPSFIAITDDFKAIKTKLKRSI